MELRDRTFLVTGGTGFLGCHLVSQLLQEQPHEIRLLVRSIPAVGTPEYNGDSRIRYVKGALLDAKILYDACLGVDGIFHLAGVVVHSRDHQVQEMYQCNVDGTIAVMEAAARAKVRRVIVASTSGVVGCSHDPSFVANDDSPYCEEIVSRWPYYQSKILAEKQALAIGKANGIEVVIMRPTMMYGPGDSRFRSTHTILSYLRRSIPATPNGGASFVDVRDAAKAFIAAMRVGRAGKSYLLTAHNCSVREFFAILERLSGIKPPLLRVPTFVFVAGSHVLNFYNSRLRNDWREGLDPVKAEMSNCYWFVEARDAKLELAFEPRDIDETLRDTIEYIQQHAPPGTLNPSQMIRARL